MTDQRWYNLVMDEELKRRLEKIEKRLNAIEGFIKDFPVYTKPTTYEVGDAVDDLYDAAVIIVL